jgi:glycosyltransferase involved in cell wall biosynthesis|tara:strand:+ start:1940 stop:3364 length:1425 start_codon:yes stop_codon:yes gene_type:complete
MELPKLKKVTEVKKKKILLLSDDLRMSSGVGTMSREIVMGTIGEFDWVQVAGAINHPDAGKLIDMNDSVRKDSGVEDAYLKLYPVSGYGSQEVLRELLITEKPDAILHYTDPRFWKWLYDMEHELRQDIPIFYYNIWDDLPYPMWNEPFYESCDLIMNISKQTHNIVQNVCKDKPRTEWDSTYVPHGINEKYFYPVDNKKERLEMNKMKSELFQGKDLDFVLFYNNRNIKRKMTSDAILAFREFAYNLPEEKRNKTAFVLHTQPADQHGTDLPAVVEEMCPDLNIIFSTNKLSNQHLNYLYNIADVTINIASNEGFGLGTCESLMCGTPIIVNVTGGLQDQCGFRLSDELLTYEDYADVETLHDWRKWENNKSLTYGEWVKPVWPRSRSLQGSIPTPYIFDDRCDWVDVSEKIREWYDMGKEERESCGREGYEFVCGDDSMMTARWMSKNFEDHMNTAFKKWTPRKRFELMEVK